jgi:hypothetical protein
MATARIDMNPLSPNGISKSRSARDRLPQRERKVHPAKTVRKSPIKLRRGVLDAQAKIAPNPESASGRSKEGFASFLKRRRPKYDE